MEKELFFFSFKIRIAYVTETFFETVRDSVFVVEQRVKKDGSISGVFSFAYKYSMLRNETNLFSCYFAPKRNDHLPQKPCVKMLWVEKSRGTVL